jgi:hypothetical protein
MARSEEAKLQALQTNIRASEQRLDDNLKREAESEVALRKVTAELEEAIKDRDQAKRDVDKTRTTALGERDRILSEAHQDAAKFIEDMEKVAAAGRGIISKRKSAA